MNAVVLTDSEVEALATCRDFHSFSPPGENEEDDKIVAAVDSILARALSEEETA